MIDLRTASAGRDADKTWFSQWVTSTQGAEGASFGYDNRGTIGSRGRTTTAVDLASIGGTGSDGYSDYAPSRGGIGGFVSLYQSGLVQSGSLSEGPLIRIVSKGGSNGYVAEAKSAANGADAGGVTFVQRGAPITATAADLRAGVPLVWLLSQGSQGGSGGIERAIGVSGLRSDAGRGGNGRAATAEIDGILGTTGVNLAGLRVTAQGGDGGKNGVGPFSGARAGAGGESGEASVKIGVGGGIVTEGANAPAAIVEALAGKGGSIDVEGAVGANGGNVGGTEQRPSVLFDNRSIVKTRGDNATAVLLQSIGGNGGEGSSDRTNGRRGGVAGDGGHIAALNAGTVMTAGDYAFGIVAQSLGGTGGRGGDGLFKGGSVLVDNMGEILPEGEEASALVARSIGGGKALDAFQTRIPKPSEIGAGGAGGGGRRLPVLRLGRGRRQRRR
ncbi:hypothetical protein MMB17_08120 [Methylobacterium organophilum]|uniref:hypothetical protein n=1 Tax=Methylobacterium organophilum TaxID=410 RepID=UPI001F145DC7|nr:hypothetical protein [Methylobacterium organophilum]UMY19255.1 hypothetical protein MMB17_08120 [Methylobacterium organophilum]